MLPHEDDKWSPEDQKAWLTVAKVNFAFLYGAGSPSAEDNVQDDEGPPF